MFRNVPVQQTPSPVASTAPQTQAGPPENSPGPGSWALVTPEKPETAAPTLQSTAGAIPEAQPFLNYTSTAGGYDIQAPSNWKAEVNGANVKFANGYSGVQVEIVRTAEPFTLEAVGGVYVADLIRTGRAVDVKSVSMAGTKSGQAVRVEYEFNSEPIDGKKVRLSGHRYYFGKDGSIAVLTMWAPAGADSGNVFQQLPDTFFWR